MKDDQHNWDVISQPILKPNNRWVVEIRKNHLKGELLDEIEFDTKEAADRYIKARILKGLR